MEEKRDYQKNLDLNVKKKKILYKMEEIKIINQTKILEDIEKCKKQC